jgi:hypothetical protein
MDHLPIPLSCRSRALSVPYLGLASPYDRKGFDGFPERHGVDSKQLMALTRERNGEVFQEVPAAITPFEYVESFMQEWLWFGLLHEFEMECGLEMDVAAFIQPAVYSHGRVLTTKTLIAYIGAVVIDKPREQKIPSILSPETGFTCERLKCTLQFSAKPSPYKSRQN